MKRFFLVILVFIPLLTYGQQDTVRLNMNKGNISLKQFLTVLQEEYNLITTYDDELINDITIKADFTNAPLLNTLTEVLHSKGLDTKLINGKIVIFPLKPSGKTGSYSLSGKLTDAETGEPLPNAIVYIKSLYKGVTTNVDGHYNLFNIPSKEDTIVFRYLGFETKEMTYEEASGSQNIALSSTPQVLQNITIKDLSLETMEVNRTPGKVSFNPDALSGMPSLGEIDLFKGLQLLPGISGTNESSSGLVIRNSLPSQNLVLFDGFTLYHLDHFFGVFSALNNDIIKDVQVYKGGYGPRYGGRVGGVVDITGKTGGRIKPQFRFGMNLISIRGSAQIPIGKKFSWLVSFRHAYTDVVRSKLYSNLFETARQSDDQINRPFENDAFDNLTPSFFFNDFNTKFTYNPSKKDVIHLSIYSGADHLNGSASETVNPAPDTEIERSLYEQTDWGNTGGSLRWGRQWNKNYYSSVLLSGGRFFRDYGFDYLNRRTSTQGSDTTKANFNLQNEIKDSRFEYHNEYRFNDRISMDFGLSTIEYNISYRTANFEQIVEESADKGNLSSLYSSGSFQISRRVKVDGGLRISYHELFNKIYREPRFNLVIDLNDNTYLKSAYGKYHQFINQIQFDAPFQGTQYFWTFASPDGATVVSGDQVMAGGHWEKSDWSIDAEAYHKTVDGLVIYNVAPFLVKEGNFSRGFLGRGIERINGVDLLIKKESGNHTGWISYSLSEAMGANPNIEGGTFYPTLRDQRHEFNIVNRWSIKKWDLALTWIYGSGKPYTTYRIEYQTDDMGRVTDLVAIKDFTNSERLPDYHRLDVSASYHFNTGGVEWESGLSIFNLYNRQNIKTRRLNVDALKEKVGEYPTTEIPYTNLNLLGITPSLFVNIKF